MKVLHILDSLNRGGTEILALDLCRNAKENDFDLTFVATGGGDLEDDFRNSGVDFVRLQRKFPIDPFIIFKLRSIIKSKKIDIVHSHQAVECLHIYIATIGTKVKRVLSFHGYNSKAVKDNLVRKFLISHMNVNIAVSNSFLLQLKENTNFNTNKNFYVIHNGIDIKRLKVNQNNNLREELELDKDSFLIGMVSNFRPEKDQLTLIKAFKLVIEKNFKKEIYLILVGKKWEQDPENYEICKNFIIQNHLQQNIFMLGLRKDIADIISSLNLYVYSSIQESFGIAAIEPLLLKVPTIVSNIPPLLEITNNGKYAAIFEKGNENDLAKKILKIFHDKFKSYLIKTKRNYKEVCYKYSIRSYINSLNYIYKNIQNDI